MFQVQAQDKDGRQFLVGDLFHPFCDRVFQRFDGKFNLLESVSVSNDQNTLCLLTVLASLLCPGIFAPTSVEQLPEFMTTLKWFVRLPFPCFVATPPQSNRLYVCLLSRWLQDLRTYKIESLRIERGLP